MQTSDVDYVIGKLRWMRENCIWPDGLRYLNLTCCAQIELVRC